MAKTSLQLDRALWNAFLSAVPSGDAGRTLDSLIRSFLAARGIKIVSAPVDPSEPSLSGGLRLPAPVVAALEKYARRTGLSRSSLEREAVLLYIARKLADVPEFRDVEAWRWMRDPDAAL